MQCVLGGTGLRVGVRSSVPCQSSSQCRCCSSDSSTGDPTHLVSWARFSTAGACATLRLSCCSPAGSCSSIAGGTAASICSQVSCCRLCKAAAKLAGRSSWSMCRLQNSRLRGFRTPRAAQNPAVRELHGTAARCRLVSVLQGCCALDEGRRERPQLQRGCDSSRSSGEAAGHAWRRPALAASSEGKHQQLLCCCLVVVGCEAVIVQVYLTHEPCMAHKPTAEVRPVGKEQHVPVPQAVVTQRGLHSAPARLVDEQQVGQ